MTATNPWLLAGGILSLAAAALHAACIAGGPGWYRFFGAGEAMARGAEGGAWYPAVVTLGIAAALTLFGVYALSGAGMAPPLPLLRTGLVAIAAIYLVRGAVLFFPGALRRPDLSAAFLFWSSLIVLFMGLLHAIGIWQAWPRLTGES